MGLRTQESRVKIMMHVYIIRAMDSVGVPKNRTALVQFSKGEKGFGGSAGKAQVKQLAKPCVYTCEL